MEKKITGYRVVYEIGTMQECKKYVKERIDID